MAGLDRDPCSFSNPEECVITSMHMILDVDFDHNIILGNVQLHLTKTDNQCKTIVLDTRDLFIKHVTCHKKPLEFKLEAPYKTLGSKLEITLPPTKDNSMVIDIQYETGSQSTALQWLKPEQTAGKKLPYLFSQCQAIHARSLVPCQDTPAVKMPYTAELIIPIPLVGLMSAIKKETVKSPINPSKVINKFDQKVPIPSYLIALVVGALESKKIGPRSKVWTEKEMLEESATEFSETEMMLRRAEDLCGKYVWSVYDLLVLPPSFPYGGMENPCLTFVTPTLLAGDKSLASVVAHEIAHSWTGNLVTNKNPNHFWLNEGHTVFVERKILGRIRGESYRHFCALGGLRELQHQVDLFESQKRNNPLTQLVLDLKDVDPDDAFSTVPYEKGSCFLMYLEQLLGGTEIMEGWLKAYIEKFSKMSITTDQWKEFLYEYFDEKKSILDSVDWNAWLYHPGMPPKTPKYDTSLQNKCLALCRKWSKAKEDELQFFAKKDIESFSAPETMLFLSLLFSAENITATKLFQLDGCYSFSSVRNSEIKFKWLRLQIRNHVESAIEDALKFVNEQGRMKFVRPLYRDLYAWDRSRQRAIDNYKANLKNMHNLTATMVGKDLQIVCDPSTSH